jgi:hypothetical protein
VRLQEREFGVDSDAFIVSVGRKTGNTGKAQATMKDGNTVHAAVGVRDFTNAGHELRIAHLHHSADGVHQVAELLVKYGAPPSILSGDPACVFLN